MKYLICILLFASCRVPGPAVIMTKTLAHESGMCNYEYLGLNEVGYISFVDSCTLYNIGDTIKGRVRP